MLDFTVYDLATGRLKRCMSVPDMDGAMLNIDPATEGTIEGWHDPAVFYRSAGGDFLEYPERPSPHHVFDYALGEWIDPRTPEEIEAQEANALQAARAAATLSRIDFLLAVKNAGIISAEDAKAAAKGEVPPSMAGLIAMLTPEQQFEAEVRWAAATTISRVDPFITRWAATLGVTDAQLDALFGVA